MTAILEARELMVMLKEHLLTQVHRTAVLE